MKIFLFCFIFYTITLSTSEACEPPIRPLVWDMDVLVNQKDVNMKDKSVRRLLKQANDYCDSIPISVTEKKRSFAPDPHYYCSIGRYWWPDSLNQGVYVNRDGVANPEKDLFDRNKLKELSKRCVCLSKAFFLTEDEKYYWAFIQQLKVWFIDQDTYMYPNFEYAQVIPGQRNNKGRSTGFIDAYSFNSVLESIRLVNSVKKIDRKTLELLKKWFFDFAQWSDYGVFGEKLRNANNNIGLAYDVTLINMYLFVGKKKRAKQISNDFVNNRLKIQILENGSQPAELNRENAFSYSVFNLEHIIDYFCMVRYWNPNFYRENGRLVDQAFVYLGQYISDTASFPYKQSDSWDAGIRYYNEQLQRVIKLKGNDE